MNQAKLGGKQKLSGRSSACRKLNEHAGKSAVLSVSVVVKSPVAKSAPGTQVRSHPM
jgi:hypothetical protein